MSPPSALPLPPPPPTPGVGTPSLTPATRIDLINTEAGRILCVADLRGGISQINTLAAEHNAVAVIHSGDFGFFEPSSLPSISDRTLRHLITYSSLIPPAFRSELLAPTTPPAQQRTLLAQNSVFGLSEFPKLLTGELRLDVPVYTVWGACEDVAVVEKLKLAGSGPVILPGSSTKAPAGTHSPNYSIPNLFVLSESSTSLLVVGGIKLRLFGLGGAVVPHKLFDNGQGNATIAGGGGTMWTTILQIGELVDTAAKVYDPTETRLLLSHSSPGRTPLIHQLALVLKADLTVSAGLHFRYGVSWNEWSVMGNGGEGIREKLEGGKKEFDGIWETVREKVEGVVDDSQRALLNNALAVVGRVPASGAEENAWKNCWNWNMPDASFGSLVLDIRDGRIGSELKSQGFNFAYRQNNVRAPTTAQSPVVAPASVPASTSSVAPSAPAIVSAAATPKPATPASTSGPTTSTPAGLNPAPPAQPAPTPAFPGNRGGFANRMASGGPRGGGNVTRGPHGPPGSSRFSGGWGSGSDRSSTGAANANAEKKEEKKQAESSEDKKADKSTSDASSLPPPPAAVSDASPANPSTPAPPPPPPNAPSRQSSTKQLRQQQQQNNDAQAGGDSSSGEQNGNSLKSPIGSGSERGGRGGRGGGGGRGRGDGFPRGRGEYRGRGRGRGRGDSSGDVGEAGSSSTGATPSTTGAGEGLPTPPSGGHKAGANGGGW